MNKQTNFPTTYLHTPPSSVSPITTFKPYTNASVLLANNTTFSTTTSTTTTTTTTTTTEISSTTKELLPPDDFQYPPPSSVTNFTLINGTLAPEDAFSFPEDDQRKVIVEVSHDTGGKFILPFLY